MRGATWASVIQALLISLTFTRVFKETFDRYCIPIEILYVVVPSGYFLLCWFIGYIDEIKGFWKMEGDYYNKRLNPMWDEWCEIIDNTRVSRAKAESVEKEIFKLKETINMLNDSIINNNVR